MTSRVQRRARAKLPGHLKVPRTRPVLEFTDSVQRLEVGSNTRSYVLQHEVASSAGVCICRKELRLRTLPIARRQFALFSLAALTDRCWLPSSFEDIRVEDNPAHRPSSVSDLLLFAPTYPFPSHRDCRILGIPAGQHSLLTSHHSSTFLCIATAPQTGEISKTSLRQGYFCAQDLSCSL